MSGELSRPYADLLRLWYEPWLDADASWLQPRVAPPGWDRLARCSPVGQRLAYSLWAHHFALETPPAPVPTSSVLDALPMEAAALERAALFVGMVCLASQERFASHWLGSSRHFAMLAHPQIWNSAIRFARGRAVCSTAPCYPEDVDRNDLMRCGVAHLRLAIEPQMPHVWGRLRFRLDKSTIDAALQETRRWEIRVESETDVRQILRAWRFGSVRQV
jgi:hypothetical protein